MPQFKGRVMGLRVNTHFAHCGRYPRTYSSLGSRVTCDQGHGMTNRSLDGLNDSLPCHSLSVVPCLPLITPPGDMPEGVAGYCAWLRVYVILSMSVCACVTSSASAFGLDTNGGRVVVLLIIS